MRESRKTAVLVAVAMLTSGLALATGATADHFDPKKDKKTHKDGNANKPTYVNLAFFGDHFISCPTVNIPSSVTVTVLDPTDGSTVSGPHNQVIPVVGGTNVNPNTCLGGVSNSTTTQHPDQPTIPGSWQVWATDFVWNANGVLAANNVLEIVCDSKGDDTVQPGPRCGEVGQDYLVVSGFATIELTVIQQLQKKGSGAKVTQFCVMDTLIPPWPGTDMCINAPSSFVKKTKRVASFSFCGKGGTDNVDTSWPPQKGGDSNVLSESYHLNKATFIDGTIFYLFDCGLGGLTQVRSTHNVIVAAWNDGTGMPGYNGEICQLLVCLFDFPAPGADCWIDDPADPVDTAWVNDHLALPGIAGTVGWNHDNAEANLGCAEDANPGVVKTQQSFLDAKFKNFPVQGVGEFVGELLGGALKIVKSIGKGILGFFFGD